MRTFVELVERYINPELCPYPEYKGKPLYSIKYIENGEEHVGYSTYSMRVMSEFLKKYFISSALKKQEKDRWRPFRCRKTTEDDCSSFDYIMDCELPEDGQRILITVNNNGHEPVQMDTFFVGGGEECALDSGYDLCDEAIAWRPLPEAYQEEEA